MGKLSLEEEFEELVQGMHRQVDDLFFMRRLTIEDADTLHVMINDRVIVNQQPEHQQTTVDWSNDPDAWQHSTRECPWETGYATEEDRLKDYPDMKKGEEK